MKTVRASKTMPLDQQLADAYQQRGKQLVLRAVRHRKMKIEINLDVRSTVASQTLTAFGDQLFEDLDIFRSGALGSERRQLRFQRHARFANVRQILLRFQKTPGENAIEQTSGRLGDIRSIAGACSDHSNKREGLQGLPQG